MTEHGSLKTKNKERKIRLFFTGFSMGTADLVPGVSGGTIALLLGIYDELLYTIRLLTGRVPRLLLSGKFKRALGLMPFGFVIPLGIGLIAAIFGLANVVTVFLDKQPVMVWSLFFGLVLGSTYVISHRITKWNFRRVLLLLLGFVLTFIIVGLPSIGGSSSPLALFFSGAIAITAMILPGISGSLIMVLLGQYKIVLDAVADLNFEVLVIFAAGAIVGLSVFVRLLTWLLKHYHLAVIAFLVGVMAGSLRRIWPWQSTDSVENVYSVLPSFSISLILALLLAIVSFTIVAILERAGLAKEHDDINTREFKKEFDDIEEQD